MLSIKKIQFNFVFTLDNPFFSQEVRIFSSTQRLFSINSSNIDKISAIYIFINISR